LAEELIKDHARSTPYTMDTHSPWYKLTMGGGKVLFLGASLDSNSLMHLPEYLFPAEYPRRIYQDEPVPLCYRERDGSVQTMPVKIHIPDWRGGEVTRFCEYLDQRYHIYTRAPLGQTEAICHLASRQFDALVAQMRQNVCWYDVRQW
jgi:aminoglycoside N3'-acetyltransferase